MSLDRDPKLVSNHGWQRMNLAVGRDLLQLEAKFEVEPEVRTLLLVRRNTQASSAAREASLPSCSPASHNPAICRTGLRTDINLKRSGSSNNKTV